MLTPCSDSARAAVLVGHNNRSGFRRVRHLMFACVGLLQAPLSANIWVLLPMFLDTEPWSVELELLGRTIPLCFAAAIAWLTFHYCDTKSGVTLLPARWTDVGLVVVIAYGIRELAMAVLLARAPPERISQLQAHWLHAYITPEGELLVGWIVLAVLANAITEELVYRALLLRALEGFMDRWIALIAHALVFELVHIFIYGQGFHGGVWFVVALIYGFAFQRTRSIAVPVLLHAATTFIHHLSIWILAD